MICTYLSPWILSILWRTWPILHPLITIAFFHIYSKLSFLGEVEQNNENNKPYRKWEIWKSKNNKIGEKKTNCYPKNYNFLCILMIYQPKRLCIIPPLFLSLNLWPLFFLLLNRNLNRFLQIFRDGEFNERKKKPNFQDILNKGLNEKSLLKVMKITKKILISEKLLCEMLKNTSVIFIITKLENNKMFDYKKNLTILGTWQ